MISARELALKILYDIDKRKAYSNIELDKQLKNSEISQVEKSFTTEIVYGVIKWRLYIDWIITKLSSIKINKISPWIMNILRIGIYQLKFLDKIPDSAAVNESVNMSKKYGHAASSRFVNAILRNYIKNKNRFENVDEVDEVKKVSIKYSHPDWLVKHWIDKFGLQNTVKLCEFNNSIPPISVRVNILKNNYDSLVEKLKQEDIDFNRGLYFDNSLTIHPKKSLSDLESFKSGLFQVQDESSMMVGYILDPKPGETILDVCAAPGGKSTHIAELMQNKGKVISRDIHEHKIKLIEENAKRLGINIIDAHVHNAEDLDNSLVNSMDRVLVDVPCSGLGIIRRKPDIKWNRQAEDNAELIDLQKKILSVSAKYVKKGGVLVYSTCTIEDTENIDVVKDFLSKNVEFQIQEICTNLPKELQKETCKEGYIQLLPFEDHIDGFFAAKMVRR